MPQYLSPTTTRSLHVDLRQALERLLDGVSRPDDLVSDFEQTRRLLEALPLTSAEFSCAVNRMSNAPHYLRTGEPGAACYELRLLLRSFRN